MAENTQKENNVKITPKTEVMVFNNTRGSLGVTSSINDKRYYFPRKGSVRKMTFEEVESIYNDLPAYILEGYIYFDNANVYDKLDVPKSIYQKILPFTEIDEILKDYNAEQLEAKLAELPKPIRENVAFRARELKLDSNSKIKAIKKVTGFDVNPNDDDDLVDE